MKRVLICGDRNWDDAELIFRTLEAEKVLVELVIHGGARGADTLAGQAAERLGVPVLAFKADWERFGKAAGPIRNRQMLQEGRPTEVWAFHDDLTASVGTKDMVKQARRSKLPVRLIQHPGPLVLCGDG